ncbi:MAG: alginate export family protein [Nevskiales bacterium]
MVSWGKWIAGGLLVLGLPLSVGAADSLETLRYAVSGGTPNLDVRLRYEDVEQGDKLPAPAAPLEEADATTLRTRLGYTTGKWNGLDVMVELEDIHALGSEDYNSCPAGVSPLFSDACNGKTTHSVIADPTGTELNQVWLRYVGIPNTVLKYGRQRLVLDNARFIGNVGWRQNEMTYDGFNVVNTSLPKLTVNYSHLTNANNIFAGNFELAGDLLNLAWAPSEKLNLVGYYYLLDFENDLVGPQALRPDNKTYGLRATGAMPFAPAKFVYAAEVARQGQYKDAADTVDADYYLLEGGVVYQPFTVKLGYEVLGSNGDGTYGFQTPLATLHAFQGWADLFLKTPNSGIKNPYLSLAAVVEKFSFLAVYHDFKADEGGNHFGDEIDLSVSRPINDNLSLMLKYADFSVDENDASAANPLRDTKKIWLQTEYKF